MKRAFSLRPLKPNPNFQSTLLPAASTFSDRAAAEAAVSEALSLNMQKVRRLLTSSRSKTTITHHFNQPVGVSMLNGSPHSQTASKILLVLKKDPTLPLGYYLLTGFPEL